MIITLQKFMMSGQNNFLEKPEPSFDIGEKIIDEIGKF